MLAVHHAHATPAATRGYTRRQPEDTVLYGVVQDHLATLLDTARDHSGLPALTALFSASGSEELSGVVPQDCAADRSCGDLGQDPLELAIPCE